MSLWNAIAAPFNISFWKKEHKRTYPSGLDPPDPRIVRPLQNTGTLQPPETPRLAMIPSTNYQDNGRKPLFETGFNLDRSMPK